MSPIPTPNDGEDKKKFISRCMGNDTMNSEYPDNDQRAAICYSQYRKHKKSKGEQITDEDYHPSELQPEQEQEIKDAVKEMFPPEAEKEDERQDS